MPDVVTNCWPHKKIKKRKTIEKQNPKNKIVNMRRQQSIKN
jgi:hypothetical protein